jgi:hypothetical protein
LVNGLNPALRQSLAASAKAADRRAFCRNRMDRQRIIEMLPPYAGVWRLHCPLSALGKLAGTAGGAPAVAAAEGAGSIPSESGIEATGRVLAVIDGEISALRSGIAVELAFVSRPVRRASRALQAKRRLAELGIGAEITADQDLTEQQRRGFDWARLTSPPGTRRLLSQPIVDPAVLIENLARIPAASAMSGMLSVVADGGVKGFSYHLVTTPVRRREAIAAAASTLRKHVPLDFRIVASGGVPCDL